MYGAAERINGLSEKNRMLECVDNWFINCMHARLILLLLLLLRNSFLSHRSAIVQFNHY